MRYHLQRTGTLPAAEATSFQALLPRYSAPPTRTRPERSVAVRPDSSATWTPSTDASVRSARRAWGRMVAAEESICGTDRVPSKSEVTSTGRRSSIGAARSIAVSAVRVGSRVGLCIAGFESTVPRRHAFGSGSAG